MRLPPGYVLPDFLNLGIAPPAPRGATAVAPRAKLVAADDLLGMIARAYTRIPGAYSPLYLPAYFWPRAEAWAGPAFTPPLQTPLAPNPYARSL